ncbi:MAG: hypothetical protein M1823_004278 [Watsoniomyces obsoletus]|nr:MAG: hypothetical protein M1823_004278 [Watsoniomyces obsoletus]
MNALNLLSARLIRPAPTNGPSSRSSSSRPPPRDLDETTSWVSKQQRSNTTKEDDKGDDGTDTGVEKDEGQPTEESAVIPDEHKSDDWPTPDADVDTPLLGGEKDAEGKAPLREIAKGSGRHAIRWRLAEAIVASIRWIFSTIAAPGVYLISCMSDDQGRFSPLLPIRKTGRIFVRLWRARSTSQAVGLSATASDEDGARWGPNREKRMQPSRLKSYQGQEAVSGPSRKTSVKKAKEANAESKVRTREQKERPEDSQSRVTSSSDESTTTGRRYIRIKAAKEDAPTRRSSRKTDSAGSRGSDGVDAAAGGGGWLEPPLTPATLKSPTSPASSTAMAKYPRAPAPPRPLIPRRRPSNQFSNPNAFDPSLKTLILDLDETLIHSLAKGGRMSTGHMVEVKLNTTIGLGNGGAVLGPQHPILYYVHKRPHCDDFLRKVCKWYKLVIFTASVQEYADPVIDWLEQDRKYFIGRYYRQHCTFRSGNYIKDLSCVEPDLSQVMIVDNSPASYVFHPDNAIPIEGWINDPTDNHLLHLIPLLEGLQYVTDVRALLALRMGEVAASTS